MNGRKIDRVQHLFERAARLAPEDRRELLVQECGEDASLQAEVESLLEHDLKADRSKFLGASQPRGDAPVDQIGAAEETRAIAGSAATDPPTPEIEGYEITRELNRGGQGVVFQAIQKSTRRKVAIKVLREGPYAPDAARRRFERELSLVASLRHPNIISIFHSGATRGGWQFYVMDYVRGAPMHEHVRAKKLALEEALRLFLEVCDAIQYAHQRGIIHRDLKQTNVIVDTGGVPHVLDFGLAKIISAPDGSMLTLTQEILGTPAYMAPEQFSGNPDSVDTRSDVYALGVVLFELLTGNHPFSLDGGLSRIMRRVTESDPTPPARAWTPQLGITQSTTRRVRGGTCPIDEELTTIVMKALSREPGRRYQSVSEFATDLRHYLSGEPITARRDSHWYVLRKTLRRHRIAAGFSAAFVAILILFCIVLFGMYRRQVSLRQKAEHETARADQTYQFFEKTLESINPAEVRGKQYTVQSLLDSASGRVAIEIGNHPQIAAKLHDRIGGTYDRLGAFELAVTQFERAIEIHRKLPEDSCLLVASLRSLGKVQRQLGNHSEALASLIEAVRICENARPRRDQELIEALGDYTRALIDARRLDEARETSARALALARSTYGDAHSQIACCLTDSATVHQYRSEFDAAERTFLEALAMRRKLTTKADGSVVSSLNNLACARLVAGKSDSALKAFSEAQLLAHQVLHPDDWLVYAIRSGIAACQARAGEYEAAETAMIDAYCGLRIAVGERDARTRQTADRIDELYKAWGKPDKFRDWRKSLSPQSVANN